MNVRSGDSAGSRAVAAVAAVAIVLIVVLLNTAAWRALNPPLPAPDGPARVAGLAYNAYQRWDSPIDSRRPDNAQVDADLRQLAGVTSRLRTYSSSEFPALPALAARHGLQLTAGVWLDQRHANNEAEVAALLDAARRHANITRVIAGNETQLHGMLSPSALASVLDRLRRELSVPVSTAEPWHVWLRQPELVRHVDFIAVHLLPYWERVPVEAAVDEALRRYDELRRRFPGVPVVIAEIGWPGAGDRLGDARAGPAEQARFVRAFLARAPSAAPDYYLMEAVDQPWKRATEGPAGAHWGWLDAARSPKFEWTGPVHDDPQWARKAAASALLGTVAMLAFLWAFRAWRWPARFAFSLSLQAVVSFAVAAATLSLASYLRPIDGLLLAVLVPMGALLGAIVLVQGLEFAEMFWDGQLARRPGVHPLPAGAPRPFVSLHLACSCEPPDQVIATIDTLRALDWPDFEVVVVDNNTSDPDLWRPVEAHVQALQRARVARGGAGPAVRFVHLPRWPGYKAGALEVALQHTDRRAEWIGVVDADYLVDPAWLSLLAGHFGDPKVAVVQAPQAHRDGRGAAWRRWMHWEYEGFFRIGMHHRQQREAIVQHGTMALLRRSALTAAGGWSSATLCEDTELGLRLLAAGWRAVYVDEVLGTGLLPADFAAYRRQRRRWAQGAMQILRRHAGSLAGPSSLTRGQRYHFVAGWLPWIGDALHLACTLLALAWTIGLLMAPGVFGVPAGLFLVPLAVYFGVRAVVTPLLYARRVPCGLADRVGAALAGMGLSHAIARGVWAGLAGRPGEFRVTRKGQAGEPTDRRADPGLREERLLLAGLGTAALAVAIGRAPGDTERLAWIAVLVLQVLPYAAALVCHAMCRRAVGRRSGPQHTRAGAGFMAPRRPAATLRADGNARRADT